MPRQPLSRVFRFSFSIFCLFGSSLWDNSRSLKSAKSVSSREARRHCDIMGAVRDDCFSPVAVISISPSDISEFMGPVTPALFLSLTWGWGDVASNIMGIFIYPNPRPGDNNRAVRTEKEFIICFQEHCSAMGPRERMSH